ncbi:hypothetical protein [Calycomorphotria hydatis]|uniref:Uncharacterized protein n=1 Tax=Calycomorphotria hydatis TaxID=2528027 RepID=A0A517T4U9_9PLAN|nr:hypothetical protein [Calycomorphotria hydatis]QDT63412.1 hypothetical protein V22_06330 [Calycomorphotria hydatis]
MMHGSLPLTDSFTPPSQHGNVTMKTLALLNVRRLPIVLSGLALFVVGCASPMPFSAGRLPYGWSEKHASTGDPFVTDSIAQQQPAGRNSNSMSGRAAVAKNQSPNQAPTWTAAPTSTPVGVTTVAHQQPAQPQFVQTASYSAPRQRIQQMQTQNMQPQMSPQFEQMTFATAQPATQPAMPASSKALFENMDAMAHQPPHQAQQQSAAAPQFPVEHQTLAVINPGHRNGNSADSNPFASLDSPTPNIPAQKTYAAPAATPAAPQKTFSTPATTNNQFEWQARTESRPVPTEDDFRLPLR